MRILIPGGSGQVGTLLARDLTHTGHHVTVLSRSVPQTAAAAKLPWQVESWDGTTIGAWAQLLETTDAVIHLSGRTVNCRYTPENRKQILESRTLTTALVGRAIAEAKHPPRIWLNSSTSTVYRNALDRDMDEATGDILPVDPGMPESYNFSAGVGLAWEKALNDADTPNTRRIALRTSMVMSPDPHGVFDVLLGLVRRGLGGTQASGTQYISWMHDADYTRAIRFLLETETVAGPVNMTAPSPLPNADFLRILRHSNGTRIGLPAARWMLELGALFLRTDTELILKSRRVTPGVLLGAGFDFLYPDWPTAAKNLVRRWRALHG